jgi:hypothetical protein
LFDVPGGFYLFQTDHHDYHLFQSAGPNAGGSSFIGGHITHIGFDAQHVVLRRDVAEYPTHTQYRLTGKVEYWVVEIAAAKTHGPYTEEQFTAAREQLGVQPSLRLEASNSRAARRPQ